MKRTVCLVLVFLLASVFGYPVFGAEKVTLEFWPVASSARAPGRRIVFLDFEKKNPGVKVKSDPVPWDRFNEKILTASIAGTLPDAARYSFAPRYASRGLLLPLDEFIYGPDGIDTDDYLEGTFPNPNIQWGEKIYGLPFGWERCPAVYYNRDLFKEAGVSPPSTWSELKAVAKKLTKKDASGKTVQYGMQMTTEAYHIDAFVRTNGATKLNVVGHEATEATYSAPENVEGYKFLVDLVNNGYLDLVKDWELLGRNFLEGKVAMHFVVQSAAYQFRPWVHPELNWGSFNCPVPEGKPTVVPFLTSPAYIFKSTKYPELAWKLLKAYAWKKGSAVIWIHKFGAGLPFKDVLDPNTLISAYYPFQFEVHLNQLQKDSAEVKSVYCAPGRWHMRGAEIEQLEQGEYDLMFAGKKSVEKVVEYLDRKIGELLKK